MSKINFKAGLVALAMVGLTAGPGFAQTIDPALQPSWDFMQANMPGVPYETLQAACAEGTVMIYHGTWIDAQQAQIDGFKKNFPCLNVETYGSSIGDMRERFLAEQRAGRDVADIIQDSDPSSLNAHAAEGLLMNYTISNDANFKPGYKSTGFWYPLRIALVGIAWNTDLVSDEDAAILSDWQGATDPRWLDRAAMSDPGSKGVAYQHWFAWYKMFGEEYLKKIGALHPRIIAGANNSMSSLASGDVDIVFNASETGLLPLWLKGAPIKWTLPSPGVGPITGQAVVATAPHPNAAKLYQEYAFTEEGYGLWNEFGGAPATDVYPDKRTVAKEDWYHMPTELFDLDSDEAGAAFDKLIADFNTYVGTSR